MQRAFKMTRENNGGVREMKNRLFAIMVVVLSVITILPIVLIMGKLIVNGYKQINLNFFTRIGPDTMEALTAISNGEIIPGGILNGITGTLYMVGMASLMAIPIGIAIGVFLYEYGSSWYAGMVRNLADVMQGVPSIVLGLVVYIWVVRGVTHGFSALAGSVAMGIMMLPLIIRSTEETLKMIPENIKEAAAALGVPYHKMLIRVLIPTAFSGLLTGILLAVSRVLGETAPLMLTALGNSHVNFALDRPTSAVPLLIWEFYNDPNMVDLIWSSSLFLMGVVLALNLIAKRIVAKRG